MKLAPSISFKDVFPNDKREGFQALIKELPSEFVITLLCSINAKLIHEPHDLRSQLYILGSLLEMQDKRFAVEVLNRVAQFYKQKSPDSPVVLFTAHTSLDFIHYELINFRENVDKRISITADQELKFLKAYFLYTDELYSRTWKSYLSTKANKDRPTSRSDHFRKELWATYFAQIESQTSHHSYTGVIKAITFLNHFLYHKEFSVYANNYLSKHNFDNAWRYVFSLMAFLQIGLSKTNREKWKKPFAIIPTEEHEAILNQFTLNIHEYKKHFGADKQNYNGLKARPLLKFPTYNSLLVVHWHFLANKYYDGLFYDFYETSGISQNPKFRSPVDFKNYVAAEISEKILFRTVCQTLLSANNNPLIFPSQSEFGMPDLYYRKGNKVLLIEFKDAAFAGKTVTSDSYLAIKNTIDSKYNTENKGTGQLIKYLKKLVDTTSYEKSSGRIRKRKELNIYPVIIYTDKFFGVEGVNEYLADEFEYKLKKSRLFNEFQTVKRLTCFDFSQMLVYCTAFGEEKNDLFDAIDKYNSQIKKRKKRASEVWDYENFLNTLLPIETLLKAYLKMDAPNSKGYFGKIVKVFDLGRGLPAGT